MLVSSVPLSLTIIIGRPRRRSRHRAHDPPGSQKIGRTPFTRYMIVRVPGQRQPKGTLQDPIKTCVYV